ncbi:porin [Motiliproteus sp. MSK22-1]|uniref:porin n=1 Tax=Motiliproteus sp. MSK22-1 TaxID=1897630 RepID=UPI0009788C68|nr:porin [Motiliproteus sp. MSK22-1]OMH39734.1 hypothetical protein BGP75_01345 [Motiliproteus sp. MSK22-1]
MKKSLIALAVAGAMTAPILAQADATLYGIAEMRLIDEDNNDLDLNMNKTRLGVKGTVDNDIEGLESFYQFEWEFNANGDSLSGAVSNDTTVRKSLVGLKGGFGSVIFGRQNAHASATHKADIFKRGSGYAVATPDRYGNSMSYVTPSMGGLEAYIQVVTEANLGGADEDVDLTAVGVNYSANGLGAAISYTETDKESLGGAATDDSEIIEAAVSYSMDAFYVAGYYADIDNGGESTNNFAIAASYTIGKAVLKAGYDEVENASGNDDGEQIILHAGYKLGAKAYTYVQYQDRNDAAGNDALSLGYSLAF